MTNPRDPYDDLVITFKPDATPEQIDRFLKELAHAIAEIARHVVDMQDAQAGEEIEEPIEAQQSCQEQP